MVRFVSLTAMGIIGLTADFGRRRVGPHIIDAGRNLSGVCGRWYPVTKDLHRFFIAISQAVVDDDVVWSAGGPP